MSVWKDWKTQKPEGEARWIWVEWDPEQPIRRSYYTPGPNPIVIEALGDVPPIRWAELSPPPREDEDNALRHLEEWDEDYGNVLWYDWPISEPPWVGTPTDVEVAVSHEYWLPLPDANLLTVNGKTSDEWFDEWLADECGEGE